MISFLARLTALAGGVVMVALIILTCASILGRLLGFAGLSRIPGDVELVEMGIAFAIFSFLPWCHLESGHATVDLFEHQLGSIGNRVVNIVSDILMLAIALLITWRLWLGLKDKMSYSETTFILQVPIWYSYAAGLAACVVFVLVSVFCVLRSGRKLAGLSVEQS